jgi:ribosomal protein L12E/L44/L45/RPP1/RPP2
MRNVWLLTILSVAGLELERKRAVMLLANLESHSLNEAFADSTVVGVESLIAGYS